MPGWNWRLRPTWPERFARLPLFWSSTGVAMHPAESTTTFASTRTRWLRRPPKGATTWPSIPRTRAPSARTCCTWTEVSTRAPARIAAGT